jgi:three-Cys-motif partner protein
MARRGANRYGKAAHTEIKIDVLTRYLRAYVGVMKKRQYFDLWYIDAFAGSGSRIEIEPARNDLFGVKPAQERVFEGSAARALQLAPGFSHYRFIETKRTRIEELERVAAKYPAARDVICLEGDANDRLRELLTTPEWVDPGNRRGVIFLDPYGLNVPLETVKVIARTRKLDVWYLFSIEGFCRQCAHDPEAVDLDKDACLSRILGRQDWRELVYRHKPRPDLFDPGRTEPVRSTYSTLAAVFTEALRNEFPHVSDPLPLPVRERPLKFLLFFCVSNPSRRAIQIASDIADYIIGLGKSSQVRP